MRVSVGYSENPETAVGGMQAARDALARAGMDRPCDMVLLFSTSRHDMVQLREVVSLVVGPSVPIIGGGAAGIISNNAFGYAGDQIGLAAFWFENAGYELLTRGGLLRGTEEEVGEALGGMLAAAGTQPDSPVFLFYDAIDRTTGNMQLVMATPLLAGLERGLGFFPDLAGAGLQGDYTWSPTKQLIGREIADHQALLLKFHGDVRVDTAVIHGCRPSTGYYTVTRAEGQTILEIDGQPALSFIRRLLGPFLEPEALACFLILGINNGDKWGEFDEESYVNHLCLTIDKSRDGIVMFEPDMVPGTSFQIMNRSLQLDYIVPKIDKLFRNIEGRKPVFGLYIDCAGRAAGYGGIDLEDALVVQRAVAGRAPILGLYSGVEIARVKGRPRALDWTGVFSLFSVPE